MTTMATSTLGAVRSHSDEREELADQVAQVSAEDGWRVAVDLISSSWDRLLATHPAALLAAITALPGEAIIEMPSLLIVVNYLRHVLAGDDSGRFHDIPFDAFGQDSRTSDLLDALVTTTGRSAGQRTSGRLGLAVESARNARRLLEEASDRERADAQNALPQLLVQWGRTFEVADVGGAREYEEAWDLGKLTGQERVARRAAAALAWFHADHGRLSTAAIWIEHARHTGSPSTRYDAPLRLAEALVSIDHRDTRSTELHLASLAETPSRDYWAAELWVRAGAAGDPREAADVERRLHAEIERHPVSLVQDGANHRYVGAAAARLAALHDLPTPAPREPTVPTPFDHVMAAAAAYRAGKYHAAITQAAPATAEGRSPRLRSEALLLTAAARLGLRRTSAAVAAFGMAHAIIETECLRSTYAVIAPEHLEQLVGLSGVGYTAVSDTPGRRRATADDTSGGLGSLTRREREVLVLLASDRSFARIAADLYISVNTVKGTTRALYRKLGVHSRTEAADLADRAGLT